MRRIVLLLIAIYSSCAVFAQLSMGGRPSGFKFYPRWESAALTSMPDFDIDKVKAQAAASEPDVKQFRFGYAHTADISPLNSGTWHTLPSGNRLWMLRIKSPGAYGISLGFKNIRLRTGDKIFVYNKNKTNILGAFTSEIDYVDNKLATEQLDGDEVMVEFETTQTAMPDAPFEIIRVSHDYTDLKAFLKAGSFGLSGPCQVNVNCAAGDPYKAVKGGVVAVIANGTNVFSGTMINTANSNGTPYLLTAEHCYLNFGDPANWVFRFNWEAADCPTPIIEPSNQQSISGATLKARHGGTDFCLVQLSIAPPISFNAVYLGWDRRNISAASTACISHPRGDIKKIALAPSPVVQELHQNRDCWKTGTWTVACPEEGSSGSALLNDQLRIVGQLFAGRSACGAPVADMYDYFGRLSSSWNGGGTPATRLKDWLDPLNSNIETTDYFQPVMDAVLKEILAPIAGNVCDVTNRPKVVVENKGTQAINTIMVTYSVDGGAPVSQIWNGGLVPGAITTITLPAFTTVAGAHNLKVYISAPNGDIDNNRKNDTANVSFAIVNAVAMRLPLHEGFEGNQFPPAGWSVIDPNTPEISTYTWRRSNVTGAPGGLASAKKDNFNYNDSGMVDHLLTPYLNFQAVADYTLSFKVAHARFDNNMLDHLLVYVSGDCGNNWIKVYEKSGNDLATAPNSNVPFTPTSPSEWRTDSVNLNAFHSNTKLQIRFTNLSGFGNHIYLDDISVVQRNALPVTDFVVKNDTACIGAALSLENTTVGAQSYDWSAPGANPPQSALQSPSLIYARPGTYTIALTASNDIGRQSSTKTIVVVEEPAPAIQQLSAKLFLPATISYESYQWYRNGEKIPGATSKDFDADADGDYYVEVETSYGCKGKSQVLHVSNVENGFGNTIVMMPNPARDYLDIVDTRPGTKPVTIMIHNMVGQLIYKEQVDKLDKKTIDLRSVSTGIYNVRVLKGTTIMTKKLVVE